MKIQLFGNSEQLPLMGRIMKQAAEQTWSVRTLQRNISSQYYFHLLQSQKKDLVKKEMLQICPAWDSTLLTVGFSLREGLLTTKSRRDDTWCVKCRPCGT